MAYERYAADARSQSVFGEKLNGSGSILYVPQTQGVDLFDVRTGRLQMHVALPEAIPADLNGLTLDETGTRMFLISNSGITIAQLPQLPLSIATVSAPSGSAGIQVTMRGSGFDAGTTVSFGSQQAAVTYLDASSVMAVVPPLPPGPTRVTVTNPNGQSYSADAIFAVQ